MTTSGRGACCRRSCKRRDSSRPASRALPEWLPWTSTRATRPNERCRQTAHGTNVPQHFSVVFRARRGPHTRSCSLRHVCLIWCKTDDGPFCSPLEPCTTEKGTHLRHRVKSDATPSAQETDGDMRIPFGWPRTSPPTLHTRLCDTILPRLAQVQWPRSEPSACIALGEAL